MNGQGQTRPVQILVALDACSLGSEILALATQFAALMQAELRAVFVEDDDLLRCADLPLALELSLRSATSRPMDVVSMKRSLRTASEAARMLVGRFASQERVRWSFETKCGSVTALTMRPDQPADLLLTGVRRLSEPLAHVLHSGRWPVGVLPAVLFDGTASSQRALRLALRLSPDSAHRVLVLVDGSRLEHQNLEHDLAAIAAEAYHRMHVVMPAVLSLPQAGPLSCVMHAGLLLVGRESPLLNDEDWSRLLSVLHCPLGLVS